MHSDLAAKRMPQLDRRNSPMILGRLRDYFEMIKFSHTLFALPFALLGAALAAHGPDGWHGRIQDWVGILLCMATARSAAMAFNRWPTAIIDAIESRGRPAGTCPRAG